MSPNQPLQSAVFEKLGVFYLGAERASFKAGQPLPVLYDSRDLTTHAVCVGMTGSGKTGLCTCLLEEAAIDGVPAIAIDLKGDLANLLLTFPRLAPADFAPWVDPGAAARKGLTPDEFAAKTAELWKSGLAQWGEDGARIQRLKDSVDWRIYTPGSSAGQPLSVLKSFSAPAPELLTDDDAFRERISGSVSGLLTLLDIDADPLKSREHILLSNILEYEWRGGRDCGLPELIQLIGQPPFKRVGVLELDTFYPAKARLELAVTLNNLLASPSFSIWAEGEPLDINRLFYTPEGQPRLSILYLAHLSEAERMFFVTLLLNELVGWVRTQSGTGSLRALLYMDEVFGYFPPVANPPAKKPMLTLLKQARAFGLGVVLSTQNPVDLDYKGLANAGTWLLGRLQTERDRERVIDGLLSAAGEGSGKLDRLEIETILAGLDGREFFLHNVHQARPVVFTTRWAMSYLRGPLSRDHIATLTKEQKGDADPPAPAAAQPVPAIAQPPAVEPQAEPVKRTQIPAEAQALYAQPSANLPAGAKLVYRPALAGQVSLHYVDSGASWDDWRDLRLLAPLTDRTGADPWDEAQPLPNLVTGRKAPAGAELTALPEIARAAASYTTWSSSLASHAYASAAVTVFSCPRLKQKSQPGEDLRQFTARINQAIREKRDVEMEQLNHKYQSKRDSLERQIQQSQARLQQEKSEYSLTKLDSAVSMGGAVLEVLFGSRRVTQRKLDRARTAARSVGRASKRKADVKQIEQQLREAEAKLYELQSEQRIKLAELQSKYTLDRYPITKKEITPRKADLKVQSVALTWLPYIADADGTLRPAW
ncbi:ATP-binding protein [bacterium]|nr:ATP-binding protein [bacterium]